MLRMHVGKWIAATDGEIVVIIAISKSKRNQEGILASSSSYKLIFCVAMKALLRFTCPLHSTTKCFVVVHV